MMQTPIEQLKQWIEEGARLRVIPVGTVGNLFTGEEDRMVDVCRGNSSVRISEQELQLHASHINQERAAAGLPLDGFQSPLRFEDGGPPTWLQGPPESEEA